MYFWFMLLWILLNGRVTLQIVVTGMIISALMYLFMCFFMDFSIRKDLFLMRKGWYFVQYLVILLIEIAKANFATIRMILTSRYVIEPSIVRFCVPLKTNFAKALLANSITLTPGTITVALEEGVYEVHCLDHDFARGIETSSFVQILMKMERGYEE